MLKKTRDEGGGLIGAARLRLASGTPEFAAARCRDPAAGRDVPLVLTQPDRPAGRGMRADASPVKQLALELRHPGGASRALAGRQVSRRRRSRSRRAAAARRRARGGRLRPDPAAVGARSCRAWAASTSTPRCCRAGAAPRRSSARSRPATPRPASRSCRWTRASTPARCAAPSASPIGADDTTGVARRLAPRRRRA